MSARRAVYCVVLMCYRSPGESGYKEKWVRTANVVAHQRRGWYVSSTVVPMDFNA